MKIDCEVQTVSGRWEVEFTCLILTKTFCSFDVFVGQVKNGWMWSSVLSCAKFLAKSMLVGVRVILTANDSRDVSDAFSKVIKFGLFWMDADEGSCDVEKEDFIANPEF